MSDLIVYLIQNFASHLLAAIITLYILKSLLRYCNNSTSSGRSTSSNRLLIRGRNGSSWQGSHQRTKSNKIAGHPRSKSILSGKGKAAYILSEEGFLQPYIERETEVYTATTQIGEEESDKDVEFSLKAKKVQSSYPAEEQDSLNSSSDEEVINTISATSDQVKGSKNSSKDIDKAAPNAGTSPSDDHPPSKVIKYGKQPPKGSDPSKKPPADDLKTAKSNDELGNTKPFTEKDDKADKKTNKKYSTVFTNTDTDIHINKKLLSKKCVSLICQKLPQYRSCESIHGDELGQTFGTHLNDCSSDNVQTDYTAESCTDIHNGDWGAAPYSLRSPSYLMSQRYYDRKVREKKSEPNPYKTIVIDFRPGYFFSCLTSCCKKLFSVDSERKKADEDAKEDSKCQCCSCDFKQKDSKSDSKDKRRKSQTSDKGGSQTDSIKRSKSKDNITKDESAKENSKHSSILHDASEEKYFSFGSGQSQTKHEEEKILPGTGTKKDIKELSSEQLKSKNQMQEEGRNSKEDAVTSKTKSEDDVVQFQNELKTDKTVGYCNVRVSKKVDEKYPSSRKSKHSLSRLSTLLPSTAPSGRHSGVSDVYSDLLSSSSELSVSGYYESRKEREDKSSFEYVQRDPFIMSYSSSSLQATPSTTEVHTALIQEEPTLISWGNEQINSVEDTEDNSAVYDVSEISLLHNSRELLGIAVPIENSPKNIKKKKLKARDSSRTSSDSEDEVSRSRKDDLLRCCETYNVNVERKNCESETIDSEDRSSLDEDMAKDLVQSFHKILSEMALSAFEDAESVGSQGSRRKYKIKMKPISRKYSTSNTRLTSDENISKNYEDNVSSSSVDSKKSYSKFDLKNGELESSPSCQSVSDQAAINSSDNEEKDVEETKLDIKNSIEKNLAELAALLPSFSQQMSSQRISRDFQCTCKKSKYSIREPSTTIKNPDGCYYIPSLDGNDIKNNSQKKGAKAIPKHTKCWTEKNSKKSFNKTPKSRESSTSLVKHPISSSLESYTSHKILKKDLEHNYSSEGNNSNDVKSCLKPMKKFTTKNVTLANETKQSKSSPSIGVEDRKTRKPYNKDKILNVCFSNLDVCHQLDSDSDNEIVEEAVTSKPGDDDGFASNGSGADYSISNQSTNNYTERSDIIQTDDEEGPPEISLGSLDSKDLSSYTILDLGLQSDTHFPTVTLIPSNMNNSWLVVQRQGSKSIRKYFPESVTVHHESLGEDSDSSQRCCGTRPIGKGKNQEECPETQKNRRRH